MSHKTVVKLAKKEQFVTITNDKNQTHSIFMLMDIDELNRLFTVSKTQ